MSTSVWWVALRPSGISKTHISFFFLAMHGPRLCLWILSAQESPTDLSMAAKGAAMWPVWSMLSFKLLEERGQWQVPALWTDTGTDIKTKRCLRIFVGAAASKAKNLLLFSMYIVYNHVNLPKLLGKIYLMRKTLAKSCWFYIPIKQIFI